MSGVRTRGTWTAVLTGIIVVGLGFSFVLSNTADPVAHNVVNRSFQTVSTLDNQLKQYVLAVRFGMLRRYGPILEMAQELEAQIAGLDGSIRASVGRSAAVDASTSAVREAFARHLDQLDRFKGEAAILRNSLNYLPVALENFERDVSAHENVSALTGRADGLVRTALTFNVLGTPEMAARLRHELEEAENLEPPPELAFDWSMLIRHARLIVDKHEALEPTFEALVDPAFQRSLDEARAVYLQAYGVKVRNAGKARIVMVGLIGALLLLFGRVAYDLRTLYATLDGQVRRRTADLATKTRQLERASRGMHEILDNVAQGLVSVELDGSVGEERSAVLDAWLGAPAPNRPVWAWLAKHDEVASEWLELGWEGLVDGFMPYDVVLDQLPKRMQVGEQTLGLEYRAILEDEEVKQVLFVISDISADVERARLEAEQREILSIFQRLSRGRPGFLEFMEEVSKLISVLEGQPSTSLAMRAIHTIKGNCSVFGLQTMADLCHRVESRILDEQSTITPAELERIQASWNATCVRIRPFLDVDCAGVPVDPADLDALQQAFVEQLPHAELQALVASWSLERTDARLERIGEQALQVAERLNKAVRVEVDSHDLRVAPDLWARFWSSFVHVLRNALDHGIESPEERAAVGKDPVGRICLSTTLADDTFTIAIEDDGRGMDWDVLEARAAQLGLPHGSRAELAESLFVDGMSSRAEVTQFSGRGVGMGALRDATHERGGSIAIVSDTSGTTIRFQFPAHAMTEGLSRTDLSARLQ